MLEGHAACFFILKQNQQLLELVFVPGRWPADPRDQEHPGVNLHERGSCSTVGPGRMRQATTWLDPPPILTSTGESISLKLVESFAGNASQDELRSSLSPHACGGLAPAGWLPSPQPPVSLLSFEQIEE